MVCLRMRYIFLTSALLIKKVFIFRTCLKQQAMSLFPLKGFSVVRVSVNVVCTLLFFWYNLFLMLRLDTQNPIPALPKHTSNPLQTICHLCVKLPAANLLLANLHLSWQKNKRKKEKKKYCRMRKLNPHLSLAISLTPVLCALSSRTTAQSTRNSTHAQAYWTHWPIYCRRS